MTFIRGLWMRIPEHPSWRMVVAILGAMFVGAVFMSIVFSGFSQDVTEIRAAQDDIEDAQAAGALRGYKNRAVGCMDIINDEEIMLTTECSDPNVVVFYPPDICAKLEALRVYAPDCGADVELAVPDGTTP